MKRARLVQGVAALVGVLVAVALAVPGEADTVSGGPVLAHTLDGKPNYDYSPTMVEVGEVQHFYWCTYGPLRNAAGETKDTVVHQSYNTRTGAKSVITPVVGAATEPGVWDNKQACNPSVVMGNFVNPLGDGKTYSVALYYVANALTIPNPNHDPAIDEQNRLRNQNHIGVAFSTDWVHFAKHHGAVINPPADCPTGKYGAGQPSAYNADGRGAVSVFYAVSCGDPHYARRTSTDGVHFGESTEVTETGFPDKPGDMALAYDRTSREWYAAVEFYTYHGRSRVRSGPNGAHEREAHTFTLYKIPAGSLLSGTTPWTELTTVDTNLTGFELTFIPTIGRDRYGNVNTSVYPNVPLYFAASTPRPAADATVADDFAGQTAEHWDIVSLTWRPGRPDRTLTRYFSPGLGRNLVTTGYTDPSTFSPERTLGYLAEAPTGTMTTGLYGCKVPDRTDYFVSADPHCEGHKVLGLQGYAATQDAADRIPLYRCYTGTFHLVTTEPGCDGHQNQGLLGYAKQT